MPPTLEIINEQMKHLQQNIAETDARNLKALEDTEKRNIARHQELKELLLDAIKCKADIRDVDAVHNKIREQEKDISELYKNRNWIAGLVITAVIMGGLSLILIK